MQNVNADVGITIDEDEFIDSDAEADKESVENDKPEIDDPDPKVEDNEWITADNFDLKVQEGLGLGRIRVYVPILHRNIFRCYFLICSVGFLVMMKWSSR